MCEIEFPPKEKWFVEVPEMREKEKGQIFVVCYEVPALMAANQNLATSHQQETDDPKKFDI